jgi:hypothetical protein
MTPSDELIHKELVEINQKLGCLSQFMDEVKAHRVETQQILHGNGSPGLIKQVDRLVQDEKRRRYYMGGMFTALMSLVGDKLWHLLRL